MPSVVGGLETRWRSLGCVVLLWPLALALVVMGWTSWVYGVAALFSVLLLDLALR